MKSIYERLNPLEIRDLLEKAFADENIRVDNVEVNIEMTPIATVKRIAFECRVSEQHNMIPVTGKEIIESAAKMFREGRQRELYPYLFVTSIGPDGKIQNEEMEKRSWREDFDHENGRYMSKCCVCDNNFIGHKRRVICKQCKSKTTHPFIPVDQST